jgi:hypothetical protein
VQYRDLLRDRKHHRHVVLGEQQGQPALAGNRFLRGCQLARPVINATRSDSAGIL